MRKWVKNSARFLMVTVGIILLTSLSIDATDMLRGSQSALGILADRATGDCPEGMVVVEGGEQRFCIDQYEAGVGENCPIPKPGVAVESAQNLNDSACAPISREEVVPWTNVAKHQAEALCARAGKRLPTATEWYVSALGTPDSDSCNIDGMLQETQPSDCRSGAGVYDMVGNAWELVSTVVIDGAVEDRTLASQGYISSIDGAGFPIESSDKADPIFNDDYVWTEPEGEYAVMRGGYYGGGADSGVYTFHAKINLNFSSNAIGFRCAKTI